MAEKNEPDKLKVVLKTNESLANAIRRYINQIPVLAIDGVEIYKNDSALYDEVLAHRIGLIPMKSKRKLDEVKEDGKATAKDQLQLTLKAKGPCTVYSGDFKGDVEMIYDKMPIVVLDKDQELELMAFAQLGKGEKHAKYSPGLVYYRNISEITIKDAEKAKKLIEKLKDDLVENKNVKNGEKFLCTQDEDYIESLGDKSAIKISKGRDIVFFVESWGQISSKEMFDEAVKVLNKNLKEIIKIVK